MLEVNRGSGSYFIILISAIYFKHFSFLLEVCISGTNQHFIAVKQSRIRQQFEQERHKNITGKLARC